MLAGRMMVLEGTGVAHLQHNPAVVLDWDIKDLVVV